MWSFEVVRFMDKYGYQSGLVKSTFCWHKYKVKGQYLAHWVKRKLEKWTLSNKIKKVDQKMDKWNKIKYLKLKFKTAKLQM